MNRAIAYFNSGEEKKQGFCKEKFIVLSFGYFFDSFLSVSVI